MEQTPKEYLSKKEHPSRMGFVCMAITALFFVLCIIGQSYFAVASTEGMEAPGWEQMLSTDDGKLRFQPVGYTHNETIGAINEPIEPKKGYHFRGIWIEASLEPTVKREDNVNEYSILPSYTRSIDGAKLVTYEKPFYFDNPCGLITSIKQTCTITTEVPVDQEEVRMILQIRRNRTEPIERIGIWRLPIVSDYRLHNTEMRLANRPSFTDLFGTINFPITKFSLPSYIYDDYTLDKLLESDMIAIVEVDKKVRTTEELLPYAYELIEREKLFNQGRIPIDKITPDPSSIPFYNLRLLETIKGNSAENITLLREAIDSSFVSGRRLVVFADAMDLSITGLKSDATVYYIMAAHGVFVIDGQRAYPQFHLEQHTDFGYYHHENLMNPYFELPELLSYISG